MALKNVSSITSTCVPDGGLSIMRENNTYLIASCGLNGQKNNGGHSHNDKLSFELCFEGKDCIVDSGTYLYTPIPDLRNMFRSTPFHNTVVVNGEEQNRFCENNLFSMENDSKPAVKNWKTNDSYDFLEAEHYGYRRLEKPVTHTRQILFCKEEKIWIINDKLTGEGIQAVEIFFNFGNNVDIIIEENSLVGNIIIDKDNSLVIRSVNRKDLNCSVVENWISQSYGRKIKAFSLRYSINTMIPADFLFVIHQNTIDYSKKHIEETLKNIKNF